MKSGLDQVRNGRLNPFPWWADATIALVSGFGGLQDSARRLDEAAGWSLAGHWLRLVVSVPIMIVFGWSAISKFQRRHSTRVPNAGERTRHPRG